MPELVAAAQIAAAIATVSLAVLTYLYVRATREMVIEMRAGRESTDAPFVVAYAEYQPEGDYRRGGGSIGSVFLAIENLGRRPAYAVELHRRDDKAWVLPGALPHRPIGLAFLAPGVKVHRDALPDVQAFAVPIRIEWADQEGRTYGAEAVVEWQPAFYRAD